MDEGERIDPQDADAMDDDGRYSVLEVFGLKLEVSNPRLAELLTMDAGVALTTDVKHLGAGSVTDEVAEAIPDSVVAAPTPRSEEEVRHRQEFRSRTESAGRRIGFVTGPDGVWSSPSRVAIVTRMADRGVSLAAAAHFVDEVAALRESAAGPDSTALFIVDSQQTADVFKVAIRQRRLYHLMRTISVENLEHIADLGDAGTLDHQQALALLAPLANIDVGEVLSVIRAASASEG